MNTPNSTTSLRKATYCRSGIIFLDETGRITALNHDFFDSTDLEFKEGELLPNALRGLEPGQWAFLGWLAGPLVWPLTLLPQPTTVRARPPMP